MAANMDSAISTDETVKALYIGQHESQRSTPVTNRLLGEAQAQGYDLLTAPITTQHFQSRIFATIENYKTLLTDAAHPDAEPFPLITPLATQDTDIQPDDCNSAFIGAISPWIDLGSRDPLIAYASRKVFTMEVAYAAFCGLNNLLIHGPLPGADYTQYARAITEGLSLGTYVQLHVLLPMAGELETAEFYESHLAELAGEQFVEPPEIDDDDAEVDIYAVWDVWDLLRTTCNYNSRLSVALELPRQLPSIPLQSRWLSEQVRLLFLPRNSFLRNPKGFPVLSKAHQELLTRFISLQFPPWILLSEVDPIPSPGENSVSGVVAAEPTPAEAASTSKDSPMGTILHLRYLRRLQQTQSPRSLIERFGQGYQDFMQSPLQPLTDNLESITYEVFETDPIKYEWYERAITEALKDLDASLTTSRELVVAVVGAGRGPLVTRVLQASQKTGIAVKCCAVEKNPNAYALIHRKNSTDPLWNNQVRIFKSDMRTWQGPTIDGELRKVDILTSELLGSFGDNELSPECLDGVQHVLHPKHGVNIPQSYSAHLTPIATPKLYNDLLSRPGTEKWEIPYVVMLHQYDYLCALSASPDALPTPEIKQAWQFSHPAPTAILEQAQLRFGGSVDTGGWTGGDGKNEHNARTCRLSFHAQNRGVCHGLAGYFETVLYAGREWKVELSTNPVTMEEKSKDMISWFPIFFPLKTPLFVPDDAEIEVSMWRQTDDRQVWYEWIAEVFKVIDQKRMRLGMSGMHSSRRNGCMI